MTLSKEVASRFSVPLHRRTMRRCNVVVPPSLAGSKSWCAMAFLHSFRSSSNRCLRSFPGSSAWTAFQKFRPNLPKSAPRLPGFGFPLITFRLLAYIIGSMGTRLRRWGGDVMRMRRIGPRPGRTRTSPTRPTAPTHRWSLGPYRPRPMSRKSRWFVPDGPARGWVDVPSEVGPRDTAMLTILPAPLVIVTRLRWQTAELRRSRPTCWMSSTAVRSIPPTPST